MKNLKVDLIPAFSDNYFFAIRNLNSKKVSLIDPGLASPVIKYLETFNFELDSIFVTHHHEDHAGGANALKAKYGVKVYGPTSINPDIVLSENSTFKVETCEFKVMHLPGHTLDHLAFYQKEEKILFCGDVLFSLGCGRLFEGSYEQMFSSLARLKDLPDETQIFCAHEYTLNNLNFSLKYVGDSEALTYKEVEEKILNTRAINNPTVPSSIGFEKKYNLFLKAQNLEEFKKVRQARNSF